MFVYNCISTSMICSIAALLLTASDGCAAPATQENEQQVRTSPSVVALPTSGLQEKLRSDMGDVMSRLGLLEATVSKASDRADKFSRWTAIFALFTVIVTGIINLAIQYMFMRHQRALTNTQARTEISNSFIEWQLKQLSEFYGPLRALLGQSNVMYRQMNRALAAADPERFRLIKQQGDFDDLVFQIHLNGEWSHFRTVKHLGEVYGRDYDIEPYFDDVVAIGGRMVKLIEEKAGFARPDQKELMEVMGEYLAHYSVLSRLHERAKVKKSPLNDNKVDETATFPIKIQQLVESGFSSINSEVMAWKARGHSPE